MTLTLKDRINKITEQSKKIADYVNQEKWSDVDHLCKKRQSDLELLFKQPIKLSEAKPIESMIKKILRSDKTLVSFIETTKITTLNQYSSMQQNNKANKIYSNIALLK